ncbi:hypothetical protein BT96DRAFT_887034 [Gymnopus androsaceus JB14]|uniref:Nephrocystin 3-like N-terminal domain-containing protein n=1 Tax=Gymnopus androsaceus JB14 TaxID=1447944 RepID=A0A6A4H6J6_9AGAR|nr:hypothetical protein BT96DRAFT_887034 [Gymnopus androsaceus JB14]
MQMFGQSQNFTINGGTFSNNIHNNNHGVDQGLLTKLNPVQDASFKSEHHSPCLEGTRTGMLETLMEWAKNPHSQPIFWLNGIAGTGKSTIAQSFCESLEKHNLLGGSFFCSRELEDLREVRRIIPTLVYFLAQQFEPYSDQIKAILDADPTLPFQGIKRQLDSLFLHPLQEINMKQKYFVLVIDALDECKDMDATQNLLSILRAMPAQFYSHIHIFISCRPEYYIEWEFENTSNKHVFKLHNIQSEMVQKDIQLYLQSSLHGKHVSKNDIVNLSEQAGKFFIYASTQVQYLKQAPGPVALKFRLNDLLENKLVAKSIDSLYNLLLTKVTDCMEANEKMNAKYFVNLIVSLADPLSKHALSELWKPCEVAPFQSILNIPESEDVPIHIFHASFPDYIFDQSRCHVEFYCNPDEIQQILTVACIKYMNKNLRYNICNMQIDDPVSSFSLERISPSMQYSCKYWMFHLTRCKILSNEIVKELEEFAKTGIFFWMETLCILQSIENAIPGLKGVSISLQDYRNIGSEFLHSVIYDCQRFLQLIVGLIKTYPLELYNSGMAWLPTQSVLQEIHSTDNEHIFPKILHGLKNTWDVYEVLIRYSASHV